MNIKDMPRMWDEENKRMYYPMPFDGTVRYVLASDTKESLELDEAFILKKQDSAMLLTAPQGCQTNTEAPFMKVILSAMRKAQSTL